MATYIESLISEVFKRPVLWDHRNKAYHNRDLVDKEWDVSLAVGITSRSIHLFNYFISCSFLCARVYTEYFEYFYITQNVFNKFQCKFACY
jgi:hypothetical protein